MAGGTQLRAQEAVKKFDFPIHFSFSFDLSWIWTPPLRHGNLFFANEPKKIKFSKKILTSQNVFAIDFWAKTINNTSSTIGWVSFRSISNELGTPDIQKHRKACRNTASTAHCLECRVLYWCFTEFFPRQCKGVNTDTIRSYLESYVNLFEPESNILGKVI